MTEAKPATDEEITAIRMTLPEQAHQMSPAALVMQLIARIDTERAARLAAEARVKVLTEVLGFAASVIKSGEPWTDTCERMIGKRLDEARAARAAIKEPAND